MKKQISYEELLLTCNEINEKHIPNGDAFFEKIDELFETSDLEGYDLILHSFQELLNVVDSEIQKIEAKVILAPTCEKGCDHCCYFPIITTRVEGKLIVDSIQRMPDVHQEKVKKHLSTYFNQYQDEINQLCTAEIAQKTDFKKHYITKQLPCPFLNTEQNQCIAYDIRPIPCRTYLNYCNPAVCKENQIPKEPFSYEFFREYYIEALSELVQTILLADENSFGIRYPEDFFEYDYLPNLLKNEQFMKKSK